MSRKPTVLLVDDDANFQDQINQIGDEHELHITVASNRRDALQAVYRGCDVMVVCREANKGEGIELLQMLRQIRPQVPVIVTSRENDEEVQRAMYAVGAHLYVPQPAENEWLADALVGLAGYASRQRAAVGDLM